MSWLSSFTVLLRPPDPRPVRVIDQEILDELEFHIEMRAFDNRSAGMPPDEARQDALNRFGDFERIRKECRNTQLGERIMLQRVQTVLTLLLLGAVIFLGVELYRGQRANEAATALMMEKNEAATASMMERLEKLAEKTAVKADDAAAEVVQTMPRTGDTDVDPSLTEIRVTYNKEMRDHSWSWCYDPNHLNKTGDPRYETDRKTCALPVKLEPGKTYTIRLNTETFHNFKDAAGRSAIPYVLQFRTRPMTISPSAIEWADPKKQEEVDSQLDLAQKKAPATAPTVVQTVPENGDTDVDSSLTEIRVTYDKEMRDKSWAWVQTSKGTYPETSGDARFEEDGKTCVLPVKLEPGKSYVIWLNKEPYIGFHDRQGRPAVPYELRFTTRQ